jgi:hypothetical protein
MWRAEGPQRLSQRGPGGVQTGSKLAPGSIWGPIGEPLSLLFSNAMVVNHWPGSVAKVDVAGSNPVSRSKLFMSGPDRGSAPIAGAHPDPKSKRGIRKLLPPTVAGFGCLQHLCIRGCKIDDPEALNGMEVP